MMKLPNEDVSDEEELSAHDEWLTSLDEDRRCPWWWWTTPAPLDFIECALFNVATTITYASTVQSQFCGNLYVYTSGLDAQ